MKIFKKIGAIALILGGSFLEVNAQKKDPRERMNVLFIAVDDMNDWIGPFGGYPGIVTPALDQLAKKGQIFSKAYCSAPACNPSRASLLTGLQPSSTGVYHNNQPWRPVLPEAVTLPQYFTANGYEVVGAGKLFHNPFNDLPSWPRYHRVEKSPSPPNAPLNGFAHFDWSPIAETEEEMGDYKTVSTGIDFLRQSHEKPFFLAVGLTRPHLPWYVPQKYFDLYPLSSIRKPHVPEDDLSDVPEAGIKIAKPGGDHEFILKNKQWEKAVQGYLASTTFADAQIGRLLEALERSDYAKNTVIVVFGDHGWHLGEKQHWRKFALWEEAARVPLLIYAPNVTTGGSNSQRTVNLIDLYPTLLELCGLPEKRELEGRSLVSLLKNHTAPWDYPSLTTHGRGNHAIRSEKYRYIRYEDGSEELYDHESDPGEHQNLASKPEFAKVKKELAGWLPKTDAPDAPKR